MNSSETENTIRVVLRTRPTQNFASKNLSLDSLENKININIPKGENKGIINNQKESWSFQFDKILHNVSQEEVFEYCAKEILQSAIKGFNGTVFAYGQTGSGKTFTISGSPNNFNYRGIIPRSITRLFQEIGGKPEFEFVVKISYLEIYNESMYDLLSPIATHEQKGDIGIQEDVRGNVLIKGLSRHIVNNEEEAFNLLFEGEANRTISEHQLNKESTRSHCIFSISLEMKSRIESSEKVMTSKLNFVDLAGSERVKKTGSTGLALKEATYINKSLAFLEQVVVALTDKAKKSKEYVPYRQSKLTHLLKDSIGGNCRTVMIATIWPEEPFVFETLSTLNFAKRMKNVVNEVSVNIQLDTPALLKKLNKEIKELKQELAMHNTLANRGGINYDPYTPEEQYVQQNIAKKFLTGEIEEIDFESVRQAKELFYQCRNLYQKIRGVSKEYISEKDIEGEIDKKISSKLIKKTSSLGVLDEGVGDMEQKPSFGIGRAPKDAKPVNKLEQSIHTSQQLNNAAMTNIPIEIEEEKTKLAKEDYLIYQTDEKISPEKIPDKNTAFLIFKQESPQAKDIEAGILQNSSDIKKHKEEARVMLEQSTKHKNKIEELKAILNEKKLNKLNLGDEMTNVIDDEECKLIADLKAVREEYKDSVEMFKNTKGDIVAIKNNLDLLKIKYVESFENWFYKKYGIRIEEHELKVAKARYGINVDEEKIKEKPNDPDEEAYANAKKKVQSIHKAKKLEKIKNK